MPRYYAIEIRIEGHRYTGDWALLQGGRLQVGSAWGSLTVEIGGDEPKSAAQLVLEQIVTDYAKARAEERKQQERELAKVRRRVRRGRLVGDGHAT